ncbi:S-locus lectin protein kinase family protein, putative [Theobroma cacao]|uniref:Receptor-like serine/threonine-protein kinase n=1 Tax=Theobroma cacao TaxID=3641 RepID=A0A061EQQ6_THECC|nr:S-locus lectin protein kinase family protein, putative [Theobroma cacao]
MEIPLFYIILVLAPFLACALAGLPGLSTLSPGNSLAVENEDDYLVSPNGTFTGGFYKVGTNAYCFSIWFTNSADKTVVWMANRDRPVNGKQSRLTLHDSGNLVLLDADGSIVWSSNTVSSAAVEVRLLETGNLVLINREKNVVIWESFDFPTDTLLASQRFTRNTTLVSMRSRGTYLLGFYNLKFDDNNVLDLLYNGPLLSSVYWPNSVSTIFYNGRTPYNSSRIAVLNEIGSFKSSDNFRFNASDYGVGPKRRLTLDYDGILRLYSLDESTGSWKLSWRPGGLDSCLVQGLCGVNGICTYNPLPTCTCPTGFKRNNPSDWSKGCSPLFNLTCDPAELDFVELHKTDYYGFDLNTYQAGIALETCREKCLNDCKCKGFGYALDGKGQCFPKGALRNGYRNPSNRMIMHIKVPKGMVKSIEETEAVTTNVLDCSTGQLVLENNSPDDRKTNKNGYMKYLIAFAASVAGIEMICTGLGWWYVFRNHADNEESVDAGYIALALGFKRFTYSELKRATKNFKKEIGKGGFGTVYKGVLDDDRVVAVKRLEGVLQGHAQFWAEVSVIGKINHRNLVKLWGFCAENEHKILVYEYVENGSLDKILFFDSPKVLGWDQRYNIAVGTAKGLAYLHEECLEWVLHCDVKPQNILIDSHFEPKVADFGMSMLFKDGNDRGFSKVRGTRGYLAPEWMMNLKIDAKADVYSYGIVLLELLTGKSASGLESATSLDTECSDLVELTTESIREEELEKIIDPKLKDKYNKEQLKRMVEVALLCVKDDRSTRPAMSKVVELLMEMMSENQMKILKRSTD